MKNMPYLISCLMMMALPTLAFSVLYGVVGWLVSGVSMICGGISFYFYMAYREGK